MYNCVLTAGYDFRELNVVTPQIQNLSDIFHPTLTEVMYKSIFPTLLNMCNFYYELLLYVVVTCAP